jgi:hypothetical protein
LPQSDIAPSRQASLRTTYLNTAANVDRAVGRVLELVAQHRGRDPGVIVVGDHGESLFDEGFLGHGYALNDAQTRIPLVVADLPLKLAEPVGQADLRDGIAAAMTRPASEMRPHVERGDRKVFQYLGTIDRPAQIQLTGLDSQIAYDFRSRRARVDGTEWVAPESLDDAKMLQWRRLITMWERMMIARANRHGPKP